MPDQDRKHPRRIRRLVVMCSLIAVIVVVSTYAWFIGMRTVNVSSFDVEIASTDSLMLSLDGEHWSSTVNISQATYNVTDAGNVNRVYVGHTNNWAGNGLLPMSSIGAMDNAASRMKLFEKASLTATAGGYRLMASRVHNYIENTVLSPEQNGYVVFDLFVHNYSGPQYIKALNLLDEEAIYLTNDSEVKVAAVGGVAETGIENSVRVAFAQIGRVAGTTTAAGTITGITCTDDDNVTGICRTAQIWEPNDTDHVANAISWYDTSCLHRGGADVTLSTSYGPAKCGTVLDGIAYPTYAVSDDITSANNVDIYDGAAYNGYVAGTKLVSYDYFTDTEKLLTSTNRPTFMKLEPNSITKIRVYIYIEGQDVDNYDFASIGKKISVKFGFTKERYTEDDINYNGPDLNQGEGPTAGDKTPPVITLTGDNPMTVVHDAVFVDPGATATDKGTGSTVDVTEDITATGTVNTAVAGEYRILYKVTDVAGNTGTKVRRVIVQAE